MHYKIEFHFDKENYVKLKDYITKSHTKHKSNSKIQLIECKINVKNYFIDASLSIRHCANSRRIIDAYIEIQMKYIIKFNKFLIKNDIDAKIISYDDDMYHDNNLEFLELFDYYVKNSYESYSDILLEFCEVSNKDAIKFFMEKMRYDDILYVLKDIYMSKETMISIGTNIDVVQLILKQIKKKNNNFRNDINNRHQYRYDSMIEGIISTNDPAIIELFIKCGLDFNNGDIDNFFANALCNNLVYAAEILFREDIYYNIDWYYMGIEYFRSCAKNNCLDTCEFILDIAEYSEKKINKLFMKSDDLNPEIVQLLIDKGADVDEYGKSLLRRAKRIKNYVLVQYLERILE